MPRARSASTAGALGERGALLPRSPAAPGAGNSGRDYASFSVSERAGAGTRGWFGNRKPQPKRRTRGPSISRRPSGSLTGGGAAEKPAHQLLGKDGQVHPLSDDCLARWLYHVLNPAGRKKRAICYRAFMFVVIIGNVVLFLMASDKSVGSMRDVFGLDENFDDVADTADAVTSCIFLVDYLARIKAAPLHHRFRKMGVCEARLHWMVSGPALVDAFATFPWFLDQIIPGTDWISFAWVRIFRLFLLFRTNRLAAATKTSVRVLFVNRNILTVSMVLVFFMLLLTSSMIWAVANDDERKRNGMESIPAAMFIALMMLTGQGSPDPPMSPALLSVVGFTAALSVPFFAVPAAMITWGFEGEAQRLAKEELKQKERAEVYGREWGDLADSSSSSDDESEMEEYLGGIAGEEGEIEEEVGRKALEFFSGAAARQTEPRELVQQARVLAEQMERDEQASRREAVLRQEAVEMLEDAAEEKQDVDEDARASLERRLARFAAFVAEQEAKRAADPSAEDTLRSFSLENPTNSATIAPLAEPPGQVLPRGPAAAEQSSTEALILSQLRELRVEVAALRKEIRSGASATSPPLRPYGPQ